MNRRRDKFLKVLVLVVIGMLTACASNKPSIPYPAFVQLDTRPGSFVASFPGLRPKALFMDTRTGRSGYRLQVPAGWDWSTAATPGLSVEIFVLQGELHLADLTLQAGGYAYLPAGSLGFAMRSANGAELLYFIDAPNPDAVIRTPLITSRDYLDWRSLDGSPGLSVAELRLDPGTGARTWLLRVDPQTTIGWQKAGFALEGYLVSGDFKYSECVADKPIAGSYLPGGYFFRPADRVHGSAGPATAGGATWFFRRAADGDVSQGLQCGKAKTR
jgi:hypothetical protein